MTRVIGGGARSISLDVPGTGTRPTSDRVRESVFAVLEAADAVRDAAVLDLYAGSGALGLEAVSRGAASADLVESSRAASAVAQRNAARVVKALGGHARVRVHGRQVSAFLRGTPGIFDLVLLDPPYDLGEGELALALAAVSSCLSSHGVVVVERASRSPEPTWPPGLVAVRDKRYGDTAVWWAQPVPESQS